MSIQNRYELRDKLGAGGMGAVYTARDRLTGDVVALKRVHIRPGQTPSPEHSNPFTAIASEFRTLAGLRHPHIVQVIDYGFNVEDGKTQPYFTMEYLPDAHPITQVAANQSIEMKVRLLNEMLLALAYLHRRGVIHCDLKPDNVLVDSAGRVKVLDFGLALDVDPDSPSALKDSTAGTLAYMAPELFGDQPPSVRSDLYAAGLIAYELFAGKHPFNRSNVMSLLNDIVNIVPNVEMFDAALGKLLASTLKKDPEQRPADANEVIRALCAATGQPVPAESVVIRESYLQASRFVGRAAEMEQLRAALKQTIDPDNQQGQVYLIGGESGVGKSRLLDELRTEALVRGVLVLRGQGIAEGGLPSQLWRDVARELALYTPLSDLEAGVLKEVVPDIGVMLGQEISDAPQLTGAARQQRLTMTLVDLLKRQTRPVVLLLEDLQWALDSLAPIKQILTVREQLPHLLVLGSFRDDESVHLADELNGAQLLKLRRLEDQAIADLAKSMLGVNGSQPSVLNLLKRETEGNAFFMVETVRALAEEAGTLSDVGRVTLPSRVFAGGVKQIMHRRLSHMPEQTRPLLKYVALAGRYLDLKLVARLSDIEVEGFLTAGAAAGVLEIVEGHWRFAHDKLREILLSDLSADELPPLHRSVALAIEAIYPDDEGYQPILMEHWHMAGDTSKELHYLVPVVKRMVQINADYERAVQLAERGLTLVSQEESSYPALLNQLGYANMRLGNQDIARQWAEQAQQAAKQVDDKPLIAESLNILGLVAYEVDENAAAIEYHQQSLTIFREIDSQQGIANSLNNLGMVAIMQGNLDAAADYFQQSLAIRREIGDRPGTAGSLSNLGAVADEKGDYAAAIGYYVQGLAMFREIGNRWGIAGNLLNLGIAAYTHQDYVPAADYFRQSLVIAREIGNRWSIGNTLCNLGLALLGQDDLTAAEETFRQALIIDQEAGNLALVVECLAGLARLRMRQNALVYAEIAGLITEHPATSDWVRSGQVATLKQELEGLLSPNALTTAMQRGASLDLDAVIKQLLD